MKITPPESGSHIPDGYRPKTAFAHNIPIKKPILWVSLLIFLATLGIGYLIGNSMVIRSGDYFNSSQISKSLLSDDMAITIIEVTDLGLDEPDLLSIWYLHIMTGENPQLGFTPVVTISMVDDPNYSLLKEFSLDSNGYPSQDFLGKIQKTRVSSVGYIIIDQAGVSAFVNWFKGTDLSAPTGLSTFSMAEYGQLLRGLCNELPMVAERNTGEFPWSLITPLHFRTSLGFDQVITNMSFLTETIPPKCEMVPLP